MTEKAEIILNFHGVGEIPSHVAPDEARYWLDTDFFENVVELVHKFHGRTSVKITFDDGNASDFDICLPILAARKMRAEFFPLAGRLGEEGYLSEKDLLELVARGMGIGSHGFDHVDWRAVDGDALHKELVMARKLLEAACQESIEAAAIPFGAYNRKVLKALRSSGYKTIYTSDGGSAVAAATIKPRTSHSPRYDTPRR